MKLPEAWKSIFSQIFLLLATLLFARFSVDFSGPPAEDAAILLRYAEHFASGEGIVWNPGEHPVDGATDVLFMVVTGLLGKTGVDPPLAARIVGCVSHILTVWLVYQVLRKHQGAGEVAAIVSAMYLAIGPGLHYAAAYFGTPFFALTVAFTWSFALHLQLHAHSPAHATLFAIGALGMGVARPEGAILALLMVVAIMGYAGRDRSLIVGRRLLLFFIIPGLMYFLWRWNYFGHPLPNPFYRKYGGMLHWDGLVASARTVVAQSLPVWIALFPGLLSRTTRRRTLFCLIPAAGFTAIWVLVSGEMNYAGRYQYPVSVMLILSWFPLAGAWWKGVVLRDRLQRRLGPAVSTLSVCAAVALVVLGYQYFRSGRITHRGDGRYDASVMLGTYAFRGYTIATTESGLLPLYSRWRAIDLWGLNDAWITREGRVTKEYLSRYHPEVIMLHAGVAPEKTPDIQRDWNAMVDTVRGYILQDGYRLVAAFGVSSRPDRHYYYVRPGFSDEEEIAGKLRTLHYAHFVSGERCINFAPP